MSRRFANTSEDKRSITPRSRSRTNCAIGCGVTKSNGMSVTFGIDARTALSGPNRHRYVRIPGLRPGLTEPAFQAEKQRTEFFTALLTDPAVQAEKQRTEFFTALLTDPAVQAEKHRAE